MVSSFSRSVVAGGRSSLMRVAASRFGRVSIATTKRNMGLKTNPHVEEWMGKREITEKTFKFTPQISFSLLIGIGVFPYWVHHNIKEGMEYTDVKKFGSKREYF